MPRGRRPVAAGRAGFRRPPAGTCRRFAAAAHRRV